MKKRLLSFCLVILICICNISEVCAFETEGEYTFEEATDETESTDTESVVTDSSTEVIESDVTTEDSSTVETEENSTEVVTIESDSEEIILDSAIENYTVDKSAPYSGEYLIITNSTKIWSDTASKVGSSSDIIDEEMLNLQEAEEDEAGTYEESDHVTDELEIVDPDSLNDDIIPDEGFEGFAVPTEDDFNDITLEEAVTVGTRRDYYLRNASDKAPHLTSCVCVAVGKYCVVWVPVNDPIYAKNAGTMQRYMKSLSSEFDSKYSIVTSAFGDLKYADEFGDEDGKVALLCYDLYGDAATKTSGFTSGLFSGKDMNVLFASATGNNMDCLHIDSWQAMKRSSDGLTLTDVSYVYETMVHELQHMVMWSNMRKTEAKSGDITFDMNVPDWVNEGYSEAAVHLCYGGSTGRINRYNEGGTKAGKRSVLKWNGDVQSYALSYLFFQYVRTQYAQTANDDGSEIYKRAISRLTNTGLNANTAEGAAILDAIGQELGVSGEELIENFWIALFMLDAKGPYGFNGEAWAEEIKPQITGSRVSTLKPGASQVIAINSDYTPTGNENGIVFAGLSKKNPVSVKETLTINGISSLQTIGDSIQLTATSDKKGAISVKWSLPQEKDKEIISVDQTGRVTALSKYGKAVVRATSMEDASVFAEAEIEVLHDTTKDIRITTTQVYSGYGEKTLKVTSTTPSNAKVYYSVGDTTATESDSLISSDGVKITESGNTNISLIAVAAGYYSTEKKESVSLSRKSSPNIRISITDDSKCVIDLSESDSTGETYYTIDGSSPVSEGAYRYGTTAVKFPVEYVSKIRAITRQKGYLDSYITEYDLDAYPRTSFPDIVARPLYGGYRLEINSTDKNIELRYTIDGSAPTRKSSIFPKNGLNLNVGQHIVLKVTGWKSGCIPTTKVCEVDLEKLDKPTVNAEYVGYLNSYRISIDDNSEEEDVLITYRINDGEEITYDGPFYVDAEENHSLSAFSFGLGLARSDSQIVKLEKVEPPYRRLTAVPRMASATVTLNKQQEGSISIPVTLMSMENEEVLSCTLDGKNSEAFELTHIEDDEWLLTLKDTNLKEGSYKFTLLMRGTEYEEEPAQKAKLTIKLINKKAAVTLKKVTAYKNFEGTVIPLSISSKEGNVEILGLKNKTEGFTDNFELLDTDGDSHYDSIKMSKNYNDLTKDSKNKPVIAGLISVRVDGYIEQDIALNITINNALPKISQITANPKINYSSFVADGGKLSFALQILDSKNKKIPFSPASKSDVKLDTGSKLYEKVAPLLDSDNPIDVDVNGNILVRYNSSAENLPTGSQQIPLLISGSSDLGDFKDAAVILKYTIDKELSQVQVSLKPAGLSLNKQLDDHAYAELKLSHPNVVISDFICVADEASGKSNLDDKVKLRYNKEKKCLEAYFDGYSGSEDITSSSYKFTCRLQYKSINSNAVIVSDQIIKVTVNITNKNPMVSATAKGQINVLNRANTYIRYTVKKNGFTADFDYDSISPASVKIVEADSLGKNELSGSEIFELTDDKSLFAGVQAVDVKLKENVSIARGQKYVFRLAFLLENGEYVYSPNLKVTPAQPNVVLKQISIPTLYRNVNMRKRVGTITLNPGDYEIEEISLNALKNAKIPDGLKIELSESNKKVILVTLNSSDVKAAKYTINLNIKYKDEMKEKDGSPKLYTATCNVVIK